MSIDLFSIAAKTDAALVDDLTVIAKKAPKKKIILYFGPTEFFDNSKYLFLHGNEYVKDYQHIYCTLNEDLAKTLNAQGLKAISIQANWQKTVALFLTAEIAVFCTNPSDATKSRILLAALSGAYRVQLWHGVGIKSIELMNLGIRDFSDLAALYRTRSVVEFDTILSPAPLWDKHWYNVFGATNFLRANYPRNAVLKRHATELELINVPKLSFASSGNVLIAPTWEANGEQHWANNLDVLEGIAKANGLKIFIKPHPFEKIKEPTAHRVGELGHLELISPTADIYPLLTKFDYLITDHSSISFDVLQTNTSMIMLAPPKTFIGPSELGNQRYDKSKLLFDFGPEALTFKQLADFTTLASSADKLRDLRNIHMKKYFETEIQAASADIFNYLLGMTRKV